MPNVGETVRQTNCPGPGWVVCDNGISACWMYVGVEPKSPSFNVGDVVRLKSGGPYMTITGRVVTYSETDLTPASWRCKWINVAGMPYHDHFPEACLEKQPHA